MHKPALTRNKQSKSVLFTSFAPYAHYIGQLSLGSAHATAILKRSTAFSKLLGFAPWDEGFSILSLPASS
jgi:hypothetical protein